MGLFHRALATTWQEIKVSVQETTNRCSYGTCRLKAEPGRKRCKRHLRQISQNVRARYKKNIDEALCTYCGIRPQFWSTRCVICRQKVSKSLLPSGARRALRLYREAEALQESEEIQREARVAASNLIASGSLSDRQAQALCLYAGVEDQRWRTYEEVGAVMNLTRERIRQILLPSKLALSMVLGERVPWKTFDRSVEYKMRHRDRTLVKQLAKTLKRQRQ